MILILAAPTTSSGNAANHRLGSRKNSAVPAWLSELHKRINRVETTVDDYIETYLPSSVSSMLQDDHSRAFREYKPHHGKEVESYPELHEGLKLPVKPISAKKKLAFSNTSGNDVEFPFDAFKDNHHSTRPDVSVSFPGRKIRAPNGKDIAMVIEAKADEADDPFRRNCKGTCTIEQLARSARSLLLAHGFIAAFAVGVYGGFARIMRFDHTCALFSKRFKLRTPYGSRLLQKFFWHFAHPLVSGPVAGNDPTMTLLSALGRNWVKDQLKNAKVKDWPQHTRELEKARCFEVFNQDTGEYEPYIGYDILDINGRLFSRATAIWYAFLDTRIRNPSTRRLVANPSAPPLKSRIIKVAWRQLRRVAEAKFYKRLDAKIPKEGRRELPTMLCGADMGELEVEWWLRTKARQAASSDPASSSQSILSSVEQPPIAMAVATADTPMFVMTGSRAAAENHITLGPDHIPTTDFPLPYPQHQTFSWRAVDSGRWYAERGHMRMVMKDVGCPITQFVETKELAGAFFDSILGHQQAWTIAGVLHRDVSVGNFLISDDPKGGPGIGFIHDFDYSSMTPNPDNNTGTSTSAANAQDAAQAPSGDTEDNARHKERTGTYYFMAAEWLMGKQVVHFAHRDLESFYWVFLWVVLRHTDCYWQNMSGPEHCKTTFFYGNDRLGATAKVLWVKSTKNEPLVIRGNPTLMTLLHEFTKLVADQLDVDKKLTYESVLQLFDTALAPGNPWPKNDWKHCTLLDLRTVAMSAVVHRENCVDTDVDPDEVPNEEHRPGLASSEEMDDQPEDEDADDADAPPPVLVGTKRKRGRRVDTDNDAPAATSAGPSRAPTRPRKRARTDAGNNVASPLGPAPASSTRAARRPPQAQRPRNARANAVAPTRVSSRLAAKRAARWGLKELARGDGAMRFPISSPSCLHPDPRTDDTAVRHEHPIGERESGRARGRGEHNRDDVRGPPALDELDAVRGAARGEGVHELVLAVHVGRMVEQVAHAQFPVRGHPPGPDTLRASYLRPISENQRSYHAHRSLYAFLSEIRSRSSSHVFTTSVTTDTGPLKAREGNTVHAGFPSGALPLRAGPPGLCSTSSGVATGAERGVPIASSMRTLCLSGGRTDASTWGLEGELSACMYGNTG
ncbi:hypothetical protein BD413DRAFT_495286 [Trametes elegans]|nr:hypothetical protein BD413DRAFT_495286 [Trametes elegans]